MSNSLRWTAVAVLCGLAALSGCKKSKPAGEAHLALGEVVASGKASDLRTTPDGTTALYLLDAEKPRLDGIPPMMKVGELWAVSTSGGSPRKVGNGVTNVPGGFTVSPDSRWVFALTGYNAAEQSGTLTALDVADAASKPLELGEDVTYVLASPDAKTVAFVSGGVLKVGPLPNGPFKDLAGEVQTAEFTKDSTHVLFKRRLSAAGGFLISPVAGAEEPKRLGEQVGDYLVASDSKRVAWTQRSRSAPSTWDLFLASAPKWEPKQVAEGAGVFAFSPDAKWLGRVEGQRPDELGHLVVGSSDGEPGREIAKQVGEFQFSPASNAVAYLELYDISARAGVLGVAELPDGKPKRVGSRVPNFDWSPDGKSVAFVSRFIKPIFSIDLMLYPLGEETAFKVNQGVFGYNYDPKGRYLVFRSNCMNEGRMCDLMKVDLSKPKEPPAKIVEGIYTFRPAPEGDRILVTYPRRDANLYDAAVFNVNSSVRKTIAQQIQLPALFAEPEGGRVVYIVGGAGSEGVYVASNVP
ncbi:MAG: gliding motility protein [Myxococcaceae bacterium]